MTFTGDTDNSSYQNRSQHLVIGDKFQVLPRWNDGISQANGLYQLKTQKSSAKRISAVMRWPDMHILMKDESPPTLSRYAGSG